MIRADLLAVFAFGTLAVPVLAGIVLLCAAAPAWAGKTTCLTGSAPEVAGDRDAIGAVRALVDGSCDCATFDNSPGKTHADYLRCARDILQTEVAAGHLRKACSATVKSLLARSICGDNPSLHRLPCVKKTTSGGAVSCSIKPTTKKDGVTSVTTCESRAGKFAQVLCSGSTHCMDAADSNADLRLTASDSGACTLPPNGRTCVADGECASDHCVDGVCCDDGCTGTCRACDLAGSVGTCTNVPAGFDPDDECGAIACDGFFSSFVGRTCFDRADVPDTAASCDGAGACQTATAVCPSQPAGDSQTACDASCQVPTAGTCTGTTAGACTNLDSVQGNSTCGNGVCRVTQANCIGGAPHTCTPNSGAASTEVCDGIDNNCDGVIDNGAFSDAAEPNGDCAHAVTLTTVGSDQTLNVHPTLYPFGDVDYFRIPMLETDSTCACCDFLCTKEDYRLTVTLMPPAGAGTYRLCVYTGGCDTGGTCTDVVAGTSGSIQVGFHGLCFGLSPDSYEVFARITGVGGAGSCAPYALEYSFDAGVCL